MKPNQNALALAIAATIATVGAADAAPVAKILTKVVSYSGNGSSSANLTSSTATWTYDAATGLMAQTAGTHLESFVIPTAPTSTVFRHSMSGLVIGNGAAATATTYICTEGNFGSGVGASLCGNYNFGGDANESSTTWGPGTASARTMGGNDVALGTQQNITAMDGFTTVSTTALQVVLSNAVCNPLAPGNANGCATNGGFNQGYTWTLATPYELVAWHQRRDNGALSLLGFKSGAAQNCPTPITGASYRPPCYNPANVWVSANGVATAVAAAGLPQWGWDGTTMTSFGLLWATSFISSNTNGAPDISDKVTDLVITPSPTSTSTASSYECVEGTYPATVNAHGCLNTDLGGNSTNDSTILYNIPNAAGIPRANCVRRTLGGDDSSTGNPRAVASAAASGAGTLACDAVDGAFNNWVIVPNARGLLILSNQATITNDGCYMFGRASHKATSPCAADVTLTGASYMIFAPKVDTDGDKVVDMMDNCVNKANSTQVDSDDDGFGNACDGDITPGTGNNFTNSADNTIFKGQLGLGSTYPTYNKADINGNGFVNSQDNTLFKALLGIAPGPSGIGTYPIPANP